MISVDSNLDVDKQISDIDQLISQDVDGIIVFPLDAEAVLPAVQRAADAGISTVGVNVTLEDPEATDIAPFNASVNQGTEQMATETADFVADELGGSGNVLGVGIGIPVPVIQYQMSVMQETAEANGLTWVEQVDNPTDDAAGAEPVVSQALLSNQDLQAIMAYNEPSALGAVAAVSAAGRTDDILITGANGTESGVAAVEAGEIAATWDLLPWKQGVTFVNVLKAVLDGEDGRHDDRRARADVDAGQPRRAGRLERRGRRTSGAARSRSDGSEAPSRLPAGTALPPTTGGTPWRNGPDRSSR